MEGDGIGSREIDEMSMKFIEEVAEKIHDEAILSELHKSRFLEGVLLGEVDMIEEKITLAKIIQVVGSISLIIGPMFSSKSSELYSRVNMYRYAKKKCLIVKYAGDTRYSDDFSTHDHITSSALSCTGLLSEHFEEYLKFDVIAIDEGQFFEDIVEVCENLAKLGKIVIVAALDGDSMMRNFGNIHKLIPKSDTVVKKMAVCACGRNAPFTKCSIKTNKDEILVGGSEIYEAVCRLCYN